MIYVNPSYVPKDNVFVMVSGGLDSIAAAHWLKFRYRLNFKIVHFNHKVQPINALMSERVIDFAYNVLELDVGDVFIHTRNDYEYPTFKDTSENGLRQWRLWEMEGIGGNFITAHHLNDAVESHIMLTLQGKGEYMPIQWETFSGKGFNIYHPFLKTTKQDFRDYVKEYELEKWVVEDPTNVNNEPQRNWIRNVVLPEISTRVNMETVVRKKFYRD